MVKKVLNRLESDIRYRDRLDHIEILPPSEPIHGEIEDLPDNLQKYLDLKNIKLYEHQCKAVEYVRDGENVIITTPTASGKTLAFNIPILENMHYDGKATALYIYPAKALANDQLNTVRELEDLSGIKLTPNIYDGDTDREKRPWIRKNSRIIITNPYELHLILYWHFQWERFYRNLKFIVIDEAHRYRGVFGSNVALLIRRLRRICDHYGSDPQFILSSATLANPIEFGEKLTGLKFSLISEDGSPRGKKYFVFYNPYFDGIGKLSSHQETKNLFLLFVTNDLQTLCFTISRKMAELITRWSKNELGENRPDLVDMITSYRAGYLPEERREIEKNLKEKTLVGVTTTNALELGIDIGSLDGVIISGYPGTLISTWQQAGRAGRGTDESIVTLVAFQNPLDQYFMKHPKSFFDRPHEHAIVDLSNPHILSAHIMCAASEIAIGSEFNRFFGDGNKKYLKSLQDQGLVRKTQSGWVYMGRESAALNVNLDNISSDIFKVLYKGDLLEKMDREHAYKEAHEGAVLINRGETYLVEDFDPKNRIVNVTKKDVGYHTMAMKDIDIEILGEIRKRWIGKLKVSFGDLEVSENYYKYNVMMYDKTLSTHNLDLPPLKFKTKGFWFTLPGNIREDLESSLYGKDVYAGGLHGVEHSMIAMIPFNIMCDHFDLSGLSTPYHPNTQMATIFVYDGFEGGIGLAEKAIELIDDIIKRTYELVKDCQCEEGCPACIYSPKCGNDNEPLNKKGTKLILGKMLKLINSEEKSVIHHEISMETDGFSATNYPRSGMGAEANKEFETYKILNQKGKELYINKKFGKALKCFDQSLKLNPDNLEALEYKGIVLENMGKHLKAIKCYDKALKMDPNDPTNLYNKGVSLFNLERYEEAIKCIAKSLEAYQDNYDAWYLLGASFQSIGKYKEAIDCYEQVLKIYPEYSDARDNIDLLAQHLLNHEKSIIYTEKEEIEHLDYEKILRTLANDSKGVKRAKAAYLLGETKNSFFVNALCDATKDSDVNVRRLAASALGKIGDSKAVDALIDLLNDNKPQVRQYAVKALGKIGDKRALFHLEKIKDDSIYYVRNSVKVSIKMINSSKE